MHIASANIPGHKEEWFYHCPTPTSSNELVFKTMKRSKFFEANTQAMDMSISNPFSLNRLDLIGIFLNRIAYEAKSLY